MALTEMSTEQRKEEQKRKRFIANAWALLEKTGQAPAPSKDYCQLVVTTEGVVWRWWRISVRRSAVVYPGEWAIERDDVPDDERLLAEIERTFGEDVKDQVVHLCTKSNDFLSKLPQKLLVSIASFLSLEDVIAMAHCSKAFRRCCLTDRLWRTIYLQHHKHIPQEIEDLAAEHSWRKIFFTDKLRLQMMLSRQKSQLKLKINDNNIMKDNHTEIEHEVIKSKLVGLNNGVITNNYVGFENNHSRAQTPVTPAESMKSAVELGPIEISVYESSVEDNETDSEIIAAAE